MAAGRVLVPLTALKPGGEIPLEVLQQVERVLRLYVHAPECRELLQCLSLTDPACGAALDSLNNLAVLAVYGAIDGIALQLAGQLPGAVGAVIAQAAAPGPEVIAVLKREPQAELQALLDALEPVAVIGLLPDWRFRRELDPATGYAELEISPRAPGWRAATAALPAETPARPPLP